MSARVSSRHVAIPLTPCFPGSRQRRKTLSLSLSLSLSLCANGFIDTSIGLQLPTVESLKPGRVNTSSDLIQLQPPVLRLPQWCAERKNSTLPLSFSERHFPCSLSLSLSLSLSRTSTHAHRGLPNACGAEEKDTSFMSRARMS